MLSRAGRGRPVETGRRGPGAATGRSDGAAARGDGAAGVERGVGDAPASERDVESGEAPQAATTAATATSSAIGVTTPRTTLLRLRGKVESLRA